MRKSTLLDRLPRLTSFGRKMAGWAHHGLTYLGLGLLAVSAGCQRTASLNLPTPAPELVLNAWLTPGDLWRVSLDRVYPLGAAAGLPLVYGDLRLIPGGSLAHDSLGEYVSATERVQAGQSYRLTAAHPGYPAVAVDLSVPLPPEDLRLVYFPEGATTTDGESEPLVRLVMADPAPADSQYYAVYSRLVDTVLGGYTGSVLFTDDLAVAFQPSWILPDDTGRVEFYRPFLFGEEAFTDGTFTLDFTFLTPAFARDRYQILEVFVATLPREVFDYLEAYEQQGRLQQDPFAEPTPISGNVQGGAGMVVVYSPGKVAYRLPR
jgi:hypothetical protein